MPKLKKTFHIYLNTSSNKKADKKTIALQYAMGLLLVTIGVLLALPLVPGPGVPLIIIGLLILRVPGTTKFIHYLESKEFFQKFKIWLKTKYNIQIVTS